MMRKTFTLSLGAVIIAVLSISAEPQQPQPAPQQPSEIGLRITGEAGNAPRYAVPEFVALTPNAAEVARMLGQVLWDDLNFEKEFQLIARDTAAAIPVGRTPDQIAFSEWREIGADAVFFGTVSQKGNDITVQVRMFNVQTRQSVFAEEYTSTVRSARAIAHTVSDAVHMQQRGLTGVARTKLVFISDRNRESVLGTVEKRDVKEVYISDYDGANQIRVTSTRQLNLSPTWGADARVIAYTGYRPFPEILLSFITTGELRSPLKGRSEFDGIYNPVLSPDGRQIAFGATPRGSADQEIFAMNADGTNLRRLTRNPAIDSVPTWSPSGTRIAFVSTRAGRQQIYTMNVDGSNLEVVRIPDGEVDRPTWAPAPYNEIAYSARTGAGYDIKVHDLTTGATRQLTFGEGSNESPAYSKTGRHVAFTSTRGGNTHVFTIARDGTGIRQITRSGNNQMPDWSN